MTCISPCATTGFPYRSIVSLPQAANGRTAVSISARPPSAVGPVGDGRLLCTGRVSLIDLVPSVANDSLMVLQMISVAEIDGADYYLLRTNEWVLRRKCHEYQ
jgi:hypothetical protein